MEKNKEQPDLSGVNKPGQTKKEDSKKKVSILLISLISALVVLIGILGWLLYEKKQDAIRLEEVTHEKFELIDELQELSLEYENLRTDNDSMNAALEEQKQEIDDLITELRQTRIQSAATIDKYKKELGTLRDVLKSYIVQVDSLNQANIKLREENVQARQQIARTESELQRERQIKEELSEKVEIGSVLIAENIQATPINARGRERNRVRWVEQVQVCFTLKRNAIAPPGEREVFLRIIRPDGLALATSVDNRFEFEGEPLIYTASRIVNYENADLDACIYYTDDGSLIEGDYQVEIYADGHIIGTASFNLR